MLVYFKWSRISVYSVQKTFVKPFIHILIIWSIMVLNAAIKQAESCIQESYDKAVSYVRQCLMKL